MSDTVILITGQLNKEFTERLIKCYENITHKMISAWKNTDNTLIQKLKENNFIVLL